MFICEQHHDKWDRDTGCPYCREAKLRAVVDAVQLKLRQYMETNDPVAVSYAVQLSWVIDQAGGK